jgi:hypothetical protein
MVGRYSYMKTDSSRAMISPRCSKDHHNSQCRICMSQAFVCVACGSCGPLGQTRGHLSQFCCGEKGKERKSVRRSPAVRHERHDV